MVCLGQAPPSILSAQQEGGHFGLGLGDGHGVSEPVFGAGVEGICYVALQLDVHL